MVLAYILDRGCADSIDVARGMLVPRTVSTATRTLLQLQPKREPKIALVIITKHKPKYNSHQHNRQLCHDVV